MLLVKHRIPAYAAWLPLLDQLSFCYVVEGFEALGWLPRSGQTMTAASFAKSIGVLPRHYRFLGRLLEILEEDGLLVRDGVELIVAHENKRRSSGALMDRTGGALEEWRHELDLLNRCGTALASVLRGSLDPLQLFFGDPHSYRTLERYYSDTPPSAVHNTLARETVTLAVRRSRGRRLSILEIGGGTGATAAVIVPALESTFFEYVFTDVSRFFLARAASRLSQRSVRYGLLDVDRDPAAQGFANGEFDFVVATNVLHATECTRRSLKHVRQLLARDGILVLREGTVRQRRSDLIFGVLDGWWRFADPEIRHSHPLIPTNVWETLLEEEGFGEVVAIPHDPMCSLSFQTLFLARAE